MKKYLCPSVALAKAGLSGLLAFGLFALVLPVVVSAQTADLSNTRAGATVYSLNSSGQHQIENTGDVDWVRFEAQPGASYLIQTRAVNGEWGKMEIRLYDHNGVQIGGTTAGGDTSGWAGKSYFYDTATAGTRYVKINPVTTNASGPNTAYLLSITDGVGTAGLGDSYEPDGLRTVNAKVIPFNTEQSRNIHAEGDSDWVKFEAAPGASYLIQTRAVNGEWGKMEIRLYDHNGVQIGGTTAGGDTSGWAGKSYFYNTTTAGTRYVKITPVTNIAIGQDSRYLLRVMDGNGVTGAGDSYEPDGLRTIAKLIDVNTEQSHNIHTSEDTDWVQFSVTPGVNYVIQTKAVSGELGKMEIRLYDNNGVQIGGTTAGGDTSGWAGKTYTAPANATGLRYAKIDPVVGDAFGPSTAYKVRVAVQGSNTNPEGEQAPAACTRTLTAQETAQLALFRKTVTDIMTGVDALPARNVTEISQKVSLLNQALAVQKQVESLCYGTVFNETDTGTGTGTGDGTGTGTGTAGNNSPAAPVLSLLSQNKDAVEISWTKIAGASSYDVFRQKGTWDMRGTALLSVPLCSANTESLCRAVQTVSQTSTNVTSMGLNDGLTKTVGTYSYLVRVYKQVGSDVLNNDSNMLHVTVTQTSQPGNETTPPTTPVLATPVVSSAGVVSLSWSPVQSGVYYEVWRRGGNLNSWINGIDIALARQSSNVACASMADKQSLCLVDGVPYEITGNSYMDSQSKAAGTYRYAINAKRGSYSQLSNTWSAIVPSRQTGVPTITPAASPTSVTSSGANKFKWTLSGGGYTNQSPNLFCDTHIFLGVKTQINTSNYSDPANGYVGAVEGCDTGSGVALASAIGPFSYSIIPGQVYSYQTTIVDNSNISLVMRGPITTFTIGGSGGIVSPGSFSVRATVTGNNVTVNWTTPSGTQPISYKVYRSTGSLTDLAIFTRAGNTACTSTMTDPCVVTTSSSLSTSDTVAFSTSQTVTYTVNATNGGSSGSYSQGAVNYVATGGTTGTSCLWWGYMPVNHGGLGGNGDAKFICNNGTWMTTADFDSGWGFTPTQVLACTLQAGKYSPSKGAGFIAGPVPASCGGTAPLTYSANLTTTDNNFTVTAGTVRSVIVYAANTGTANWLETDGIELRKAGTNVAHVLAGHGTINANGSTFWNVGGEMDFASSIGGLSATWQLFKGSTAISQPLTINYTVNNTTPNTPATVTPSSSNSAVTVAPGATGVTAASFTLTPSGASSTLSQVSFYYLGSLPANKLSNCRLYQGSTAITAVNTGTMGELFNLTVPVQLSVGSPVTLSLKCDVSSAITSSQVLMVDLMSLGFTDSSVQATTNYLPVGNVSVTVTAPIVVTTGNSCSWSGMTYSHGGQFNDKAFVCDDGTWKTSHLVTDAKIREWGINAVNAPKCTIVANKYTDRQDGAFVPLVNSTMPGCPTSQNLSQMANTLNAIQALLEALKSAF